MRIASGKRTTFMSEVKEEIPGPGNYNQSSDIGSGKAFTFQGKKDQKYNDVPGPGSYDTKDDVTRPG